MATMRSLTTPYYSFPSAFEITAQPRPVISAPTDVLVRVHAASVNPIDVKKASGKLKLALRDEFPYKIGYDVSGTVIGVGADVKKLKVGDEVFARLPEVSRGSMSEYAMCAEFYVALKPPGLSFSDAASLPLAGMIVLQALRTYKGGLEGKTVFIPAGLSGTGAYACQLAKNEFHAGKVITTVSTDKVERVAELLGKGVVDQIIDYKKDDPRKMIPPGSVDFLLDTTGQAMQFLSLMVPKTGLIKSISLTPSGPQIQASGLMRLPSKPQVSWWVSFVLTSIDAVRQARAWRRGIEYAYLFLEPNATDLETLGGFTENGKLRPVIGSRVDFNDIEEVRKACLSVYNGKGGVGKTVIEVIRQ